MSNLARGPGDTGRLGIKSRGALGIGKAVRRSGATFPTGTLRGFDSRYPHKEELWQ